jgi:hypothetical protein
VGNYNYNPVPTGSSKLPEKPEMYASQPYESSNYLQGIIKSDLQSDQFEAVLAKDNKLIDRFFNEGAAIYMRIYKNLQFKSKSFPLLDAESVHNHFVLELPKNKKIPLISKPSLAQTTKQVESLHPETQVESRDRLDRKQFWHFILKTGLHLFPDEDGVEHKAAATPGKPKFIHPSVINQHLRKFWANEIQPLADTYK